MRLSLNDYYLRKEKRTRKETNKEFKMTKLDFL